MSKACSQISIVNTEDGTSVRVNYTYYKLQSPSITPSVPTTANGNGVAPSGWTDVEPTYISGSSDSLYTVDLTIYSTAPATGNCPSGTFIYSKVSKSSSYEAAKEAWNKADNAQGTANDANNKIDNLEIGGRNLAIGTKNWSSFLALGGCVITDDILKVGLALYPKYSMVRVNPGDVITISVDVKSETAHTDNTYGILLDWVDDTTNRVLYTWWNAKFDTEFKRISKTITVPNNESIKGLCFAPRSSSGNVNYYRHLKIEKGNKATDWSPAPEDLDSAISTTVKSTDVEYYLSTSPTQLSGGEWKTTADTWVNGKYMWSRTKTTLQNGTSSYKPSENGVCIAGAKGDNGVSSYVHIKYSNDNLKFTANNGETIGAFIGVCTNDSPTAPTTFSSYEWSKTSDWAGKDKWRVDVYTKNTFVGVNGSNTSPVLSDFDDETIITSFLVDDSQSTTWGYGNNFLAKIYAYVYCNEDSVFTSNYKSDDGSTIFLNGTQVSVATSCVDTAVTLNLKKGWNEIMIIMNEVSGSEYAFFSIKLSEQPYVEFMSAYEEDKIKVGQQGAKGDAGTSVTVSSTSVTYQAGSSGTTAPTGTWTNTVPPVNNGQYLWTKTVVTYSDGNSTTSYSIAYNGTNGTNGTSVSITGASVQYAKSSSGTTAPTSGWQNDVASVTYNNGEYLWTKTVVNYSGNKSTTSYSVSYKGINGIDGTSITVSQQSVEYQVSDSGTTTPTGTWSSTIPNTYVAGKYLWTKTYVKYSDGNSTTAYSVAYKGTNGTSNYTHIKYSASSDGSNFVASPTSATKYIGVCTSTSSTAPTDKTKYSWSKFIGDNGANGNGIQSITYYYKATSTSTAPSANDITSTSIPTLSSTNKYLWQKEVIDFTDANVSDKTSVLLLAVYGDTGEKGESGNIAKLITVNDLNTMHGDTYVGKWYIGGGVTIANKPSNVDAFGLDVIRTANGWYSQTLTPSNVNTNTLWMRSWNSSAWTNWVEKGKDGQNGKSIGSIENWYLASSLATGVTTSTTGWNKDVTTQTLTSTNKYLWNYEKVLYTDGTTASTTTPCIIGNYASNGIGIKSVAEYYYKSTSGTTTPATNLFSTTVPTLDATNKYLWNYELITYSDNSTNANSISKRVIGVYGDKGNTGATGQGISSITELYKKLNTKEQQPKPTSDSGWSTTPPTWESGYYIHTCSKIVYTNPSKTEYTTPICDSSWEAVNNVQVGGRNLILNSSGTELKGLFSNFNGISDDGYCYHRLRSQKTYTSINLESGFILGCREYEVGKQVTFSYDIMFTEWNFPEGTTRSEFWFGQRYTNQTIAGGSTDGQWRSVTNHSLPLVGSNGCELNKWFHVTKVFTIPNQAAEGIGTAASIQFYNSNADVEASFTFKLRNVMLEYGNKESNWSPAPEDIDNALNEIKDKIDDDNNKLDDKLTDYINGKVENIYESAAAEYKRIMDETELQLKNYKSEVSDYMQLLDTGLIISVKNKNNGSSDNNQSSFSTVIDNQGMYFKESDKTVAFINNKQLYISDAVIQNALVIGKFFFNPRSDGGISLVWQG